MAESHSGYQMPLEMEDVPINNFCDDNTSKSKTTYVKLKEILIPSPDIANRWDFYKRYKTSFFSVLMSMAVLLLFIGTMIYLSLHSDDGMKTVNIETNVEEMADNQLLKLQYIDDPTGNTIGDYIYEIFPEVKRIRRDVRKLEEQDEKINNNIDEKRYNLNYGTEKWQKKNKCRLNKKHCEMVLRSMQSLVESARKNVDDLNYLVDKIRLNEFANNPDPKYKDFLQCMECGKLSDDDSIAFIDPENNQEAEYARNNHKNYQMQSMPSVFSDNSELSSDENLEDYKSQIQKSHKFPNDKISSLSTPGSNIKKTVHVSKSKKLSDGAEITEIIRNITIVRRLDGKPEIPETKVSAERTEEPEISTAKSFNFDSLTPLRPQPAMQVIDEVPPTTYDQSAALGWKENSNTGGLIDEIPASDEDTPNARFYENDVIGEPRILTGSHYSPSKSNFDGNSMSMPTAESMKTGQQVQITPYAPYSICYYGAPPIGAPSGIYKQIVPGIVNNFAASSSGGNYPPAGHQYPIRGPGSFTSQHFVPWQYQQQQQSQQHQQQANHFGPMPFGNVPTGFQQGHRVEPTGPGGQIFSNNIGFPPTAAGIANRIPLFCNYMQPPTFQLAPVAGIADFQRSFDDSIVTQPRWGWESSNNKPGNRKDCDKKSRLCSDGSRCINKKLWCDGKVDCPDVSDEARCSCRERLRKKQICDGYFDCPHGTDELGCSGCPEDSFSCDVPSHSFHANENCVPLTQRCDGLTQCSNGKDEMGCTILTESYIDNRDVSMVGYTSGYLHKNWEGRWYPVCSRTMEWAIDACSSENHLPITEKPKIHFASVPTRYTGPYLIQSNDGGIDFVSTCNAKAVNVICPRIPCGTKVVSDDYHYFSMRENNEEHEKDNRAEDSNNRNNEDNEIVGDSRIVGGRASQPKAWPSMVGIFKDGLFFCGGTIIDEEWVLTAAHCIERYSRNYYEIRAGLLRRSSFSPTLQIRKAVSIKIHAKYERNTMSNDLALMKLNKPLRFNRWVRPSCLPNKSFHSSAKKFLPFPDTICIAMGWGKTFESGPDADDLREVEVPILRKCKHREDQHDGTICAGMPEGGRDACQGDSGGPLMCKQPNSQYQWYIAGIVSHGDGCARRDEPGIYTRVSKFVDWIHDTMNSRNDLVIQQKALDTCPGFSCERGLGKCLPPSMRCNRIIDCLNAEDEMNCPLRNRNISSARASSISENDSDLDVPSSESVEPTNPDNENETETEAPVIEKEEISDVESEIVGLPVNTTSDDEEISTTTIQVDPVTTSAPVAEKNINDTTSSSTLSHEQSSTTTEKPQTLPPPRNTIKNVPRFMCKEILQTIPMNQRCNRVIDCEDGTDEKNCNCKDYLALANPIAICDGHYDCFDKTDEYGCGFCKDDVEFTCSRSGTCIPWEKKCDEIIDCPYMEDEIDCFALTNGKHINMDLENRPHLNLEGVISKAYNSSLKWRPACQKQNATSQALFSNEFCTYFGFGAAEFVDEVRVKDASMEKRYSWPDDVKPYEYPPIYTPPDDDDKTCRGIYVKCKPILSINTSFIIATNPKNNELSYLLPWQAHIFVDGHYHCPAILLDYSWLLSTSKCAQNLDLQNNYTVALLGPSPTYLYVDGPNQQIVSIDSIKILNKLDAAMMHLQIPVNMTRHVQPIFLEKKFSPPTSNDLCIATGVDDKHQTKSTYLRPVPKNCPPCHRCYRNATFEDCTNKNKSSTNWSGTVVCRGSGSWYPAAIFEEKDIICGFQSSQTLMSIDYGFAHFTEAIEETFDSINGPSCDGIRCSLGNCIPWNKVCNGIDDCRDGADEDKETCENIREIGRATNDIRYQCDKSELRCTSGQCVAKKSFCNGIHDCEDGSDEPAICDCAAYLKLTAPERLCDNIRHCFDKSDENSETCSCKDSSFKCTSGVDVTESCVSHDFVCDGTEDCANGNDEKMCRSVKGMLRDPPGTGEVLRRSFGVWHSECFPEPITTTEEISELCRTMGYNDGTELEFENNENPYAPPMSVKVDQFFMIRLNSKSWITTRADKPLVNITRMTEPCHRAFVKCT